METPKQLSLRNNPLEPSTSLLVKLGSIAVHTQELMAPGRHEYDISALGTLFQDADVIEWIASMDKMAFLPKKRS